MRRRKFENEREHWFDTGIVRGHYHLDYKNGCPHGHAFWNHPNGVRSVEGYYNRGIRAGMWCWYSESGETLKVAKFGSGEYKKPPAPEHFDASVCTPGNTILLDEEYGFRQWFWLPDRSVEETISWWSELDAVSPWYMTPKYLPGILVNAEVTADLFHQWYGLDRNGHFVRGHINEDEDSHLKRPSGEFIRVKGWQHGT